jgi:hypothetical protein
MERISIRRDLFSFLRQPDYETMHNLTVKSKILILFKVLILTYIGLIIVSIPLVIFQKLEIIGEVTQKTKLVYEIIKREYVNYKPFFLVALILIGPILTEFSYRLALKNFNDKFLAISCSLLIGTYLGDYLSKLLWLPHSYFAYILSIYINIIIVSGLFYLVLRTNYIKRYFNRIKTFWNTRPGLIFYLISALFVISHIINLEIRTNDLIFIPIIILPFFIYGLSFGYIRVRLGIKYSIISHIVINFLIFGLADLIKH